MSVLALALHTPSVRNTAGVGGTVRAVLSKWDLHIQIILERETQNNLPYLLIGYFIRIQKIRGDFSPPLKHDVYLIT